MADSYTTNADVTGDALASARVSCGVASFASAIN